jgi:hypothetical protein
VEADERPAGGQLVRLERVHLRPVADHERDTVLAEQRVRLLDEPGRVSELDAVAQAGRQPGERLGEPVVVAAERRRQLPEERPELR